VEQDLRDWLNAVGSMDISNQLTRAFNGAGTAGGTFRVIDNGVEIGDRDSAGGAIFLTQPAADAADGAQGFSAGALIFICAGDEDICGIWDVSDNAARAGVGAQHTMGTPVRVHDGDAVGVNMDSVELTNLDAGAESEATVGAVEDTVTGDFHSGDAVLEAGIAGKFPSGAVAACAAHVSDAAFLRSDLHAHHGGDPADL